MRLVKIDAAKAQSTVQAAVAGWRHHRQRRQCSASGTMPISPNRLVNTLNGRKQPTSTSPNHLLDHLKNINDPLCHNHCSYAILNAASGADQTAAAGTIDPTRQIGTPTGKDNGTVVAGNHRRRTDQLYQYSQVDRRRMLKVSSPSVPGYGRHKPTCCWQQASAIGIYYNRHCRAIFLPTASGRIWNQWFGTTPISPLMHRPATPMLPPTSLTPVMNRNRSICGTGSHIL